MSTWRRSVLLAVGLLAAAAPPGQGADRSNGADPPTPPAPGEIVRYADVAKLKPFLPPAFWRERKHFFYDGMELTIGPAHRDYTPAAAYEQATKRFGGNARIGVDGSLVGHVAGQPFPVNGIDCKNDPEAGVKFAWNFDQQWEGSGSRARFRVTFLRRGRVQDGGFEGRSGMVRLANRVEAHYLAHSEGTVFAGERRKLVTQIDLTAPRGARGTWTRFTRYRSSEGPLAQARLDDTWSYAPSVGQVRHTSSTHRANPVESDAVVPDDLAGFGGVVPQYEWTCLAETELFAPVNSMIRGYPDVTDHDFGPSGLSFASDRWELRPVIVLRMVPKDPDHPYAKKELYVDRQTLRALYVFAYDRMGQLWKVIWHNGRWSEDDPDYYPGWEGVPEPRDAKTVSDIVLDVQTGVGTRIEYWDNHGTPIGGQSEIKRFIEQRMRQQGI